MKIQLLKFLRTTLVSGSSSVAVVVVLLALCAACPNADAGSAGVRAAPRDSSWHGVDRHWSRGWYWSAMAPGMVLPELPVGYVQVSVGATGYYYYDGVFFRPVASLSSGYAVVAPPVGVVVPQLPTGAELVTIGGARYYYAGGAFYAQEPTGFAIVPAQPGTRVTTPPLGAPAVTVNGALYYQAATTYYQPVAVDGTTVYTSVN